MPNLVSGLSKVHERQLDSMVRSQDLVLRVLERGMVFRRTWPRRAHVRPLDAVMNSAGGLMVQLIANARDRASFQYRFTSEILTLVAPSAIVTPDVALAEVRPLGVAAKRI